jgi:uncharacterized protein with von Willebrand factor type A (vWA) domain
MTTLRASAAARGAAARRAEDAVPSLTLSSMTGDGNGAGALPATPPTAVPPAAIADAVAAFARRLRWLGVEVSLVEVTDALRAIGAAGAPGHGALPGRAGLRRLLQVTMVKRAADLPAFHAAFDLLFPAAEGLTGQSAATAGGGVPGPSDGEAGDPGPADDAGPAATDLLSRLVEALRGTGSGDLAGLAGEVIDAYAGLGSGQVAGTERYYQYRVMRQLDLSSLLQRAMRAGPPAGTDPLASTASPLGRQLASREQRERAEELRAEIAAQLRARLAAGRTVEDSLSQLRESVLDTEFLQAGPADLEAMRAIVAPLARRLAATARRRRRTHPTGRLDVRRTLRRSMASGGVPLAPAWQHRRRPRPRVLVLCDVSGSVAEFAKFTLSLLHALHAELPMLRSFVFADGIAEVTDLIEASPGVIDTRLLLSRPGVTRADGHSDYGAVLGQFLGTWGRDLSRDCVLLICGDARANYRPERADALRALRERVRAVHWLNPEPQADWDAADSRMSAYRPHCDTVTEVRTIRQLSDWAGTLL